MGAAPALSACVLMLGIVACAAAPTTESTKPSDLWRDVPQATGRSGIAHICPYAKHLAYTSRHVILDRSAGSQWFIPLTWQQGELSGSFFPLYTDSRRDLAVGCVDEPFMRWFERATEAPQLGETLHVPAHKWLEAGGEREGRKVIFEGVVGGMVRLRGDSMPASSGACITNEDGQLVAVHDWSVGRGTLYAAGVWGDWGEIPPKWRDRDPLGWVGATKDEGCQADFFSEGK